MSNSTENSVRVNCDANSRKIRTKSSKESLVKKVTFNLQPAKKPSKIKPKYFTSRSGIDDSNERNLLEEPSPFHYPKETEEVAHKVMTKAWNRQERNKERSFKYYERNNYKSRQQTDLLNRLYVKEAEVKSAKMIKDLDSEFFSIIQGRAIKEKLKIRTYVRTVREVLKTRIVTGYREDDIIMIDESLLIEQKHIDDIRAHYQRHLNLFEEFLFDDHTKSMNLLNESDAETSLAQQTYNEFRQLSKEYGAMRSILYSTEEKWRNCKLYQRFLYLVSPMSWREVHDYYYYAASNHDMTELEDAGKIFGKYRLDVSDQNSSLMDLIGHFNDEVALQTDPLLYFTDPKQLLDVFRFMELQNLNSLLHSEELAVPLENVREAMARAQRLFHIETAALQDQIDKLAGGISWEEDRAQYLEELAMELVGGEFKNLVVSGDVLDLQVFVEDVYETSIGPNDANLTIGEMMKMVELKFREELISLDQMPSDQVTLLEVSCYRQETKALKEAKTAARKLAEFEMLYQKLQKVFAKPPVKTTKDLKWRSPPYNPPKPVPPPPRQLTDEEKEFLEFFTEYCRHTDDPRTYGIDITPARADSSAAHEDHV